MFAITLTATGRLFAILGLSVALSACANATSEFLLPTAQEPKGARQLVVISDLHMGGGRQVMDGAKSQECDTSAGPWERIEDFRWCKEFQQYLASLNSISSHLKIPTDLVIAGDFLELWQSTTNDCGIKGKGNLSCNAEQAEKRVARVLAGHTDTLAAFRNFTNQEHDNRGNRLILIPGNHDAALVFDRIAKQVIDTIGAKPGRVLVMKPGYWRSSDGRIFVEHGHQMEADPSMYRDLNRPAFCMDKDENVIDCNSTNGGAYLQKPGGENFVQGFFNTYEERFPIIDNLAKETLGVSRAIAASDTFEIVGAGIELAMFLLFGQTLEQAIVFLEDNSDASTSGKPKWDYAAFRAGGADMLLANILEGSRIRNAILENATEQELAARAMTLSEQRIDAICGVRIELIKKHPERNILACPRKDKSKLGGQIVRALKAESDILASHMKFRRKSLPATANIPFDIYIFGHTHKAFRGCRLDQLAHDATFNPVLFNSGAWQRVANEKQLHAIQKEKDVENDEAMLRLSPSDLHPCYSHIRVETYGADPKASLKTTLEYWVQDPVDKDLWYISGSCPYEGASAQPPAGCQAVP